MIGHDSPKIRAPSPEDVREPHWGLVGLAAQTLEEVRRNVSLIALVVELQWRRGCSYRQHYNSHSTIVLGVRRHGGNNAAASRARVDSNSGHRRRTSGPRFVESIGHNLGRISGRR